MVVGDGGLIYCLMFVLFINVRLIVFVILEVVSIIILGYLLIKVED